MSYLEHLILESKTKYTSEVDVDSATNPYFSVSAVIRLPSSFKTGKPRPRDTKRKDYSQKVKRIDPR